MENIQFNSDKYFEATLAAKPLKEILLHELKQLRIGLSLGFKSLIYSRKWVIYLVMCLLPLALSLFIKDRLMGSNTAPEAFVGYLIGIMFFLLFTFGCLLISLPISSDEIVDQMMDLYIVRPVRRETLWFARWIVVNTGVFLINFFIALIYYLYYSMFDDRGDFLAIAVHDLDVLMQAAFFILLASLMYSGIFLFVGMIGNKSFTFGLVLALFEQFFLSMLFLDNDPIIPRTNMLKLADWIFAEDYYKYDSMPKSLSLLDSWIYLVIFCLISFAIGTAFMRRKEFN